MKFSYLQSVSTMFLILLLFLIAFPVNVEGLNSGYDAIHTRVLPDNIELTEPKSVIYEQYGTMMKYSIVYEIWNPTSSGITKYVERGYSVFKLVGSDDLEIRLLNLGASQSSITFPPGITTYNISLVEYWDIRLDGRLNEGEQQMTIIPDPVHGMKNVISIPSKVSIDNNNKTTAVTQGDVPSDWGKTSSTATDLSIKINHVGLHIVEINNKSVFGLSFDTQYWNPSDEVLQITSSADCNDGTQVHHGFDVMNDLVFWRNEICHATVTTYEFQPGLHNSTGFGTEFLIYNLNDTKLPDGTYTFLYQVAQNPDLVFNGYMHVINHSLSFDYDQLPDYWGNSTAYHELLNSRSSQESTLPMNWILGIVALGTITVTRNYLKKLRIQFI